MGWQDCQTLLGDRPFGARAYVDRYLLAHWPTVQAMSHKHCQTAQPRSAAWRPSWSSSEAGRSAVGQDIPLIGDFNGDGKTWAWVGNSELSSDGITPVSQ
jgi:hypothetical protein